MMIRYTMEDRKTVDALLDASRETFNTFCRSTRTGDLRECISALLPKIDEISAAPPEEISKMVFDFLLPVLDDCRHREEDLRSERLELLTPAGATPEFLDMDDLGEVCWTAKLFKKTQKVENERRELREESIPLMLLLTALEIRRTKALEAQAGI